MTELRTFSRHPLLQNIDAIILDFGGVLYDLDFAALTREFEALGVQGFKELFSRAKQSDLFENFERGEVTPTAFREGVRSLIASDLKRRLSDAEIDQAWNAILAGLPKQRFEILERLAQTHPLYILSNTNEIHIEHFEKEIDKVVGIERWRGLFGRIHYSSRIEARKPEARSYERVIEEHGLNPSRTLFIDDHSPNIEGAKETGLATHYLDVVSGVTLEKLFKF